MNTIESNVRSYNRSFPAKFIQSIDSILVDENYKEYIDFFTGAGTINYGHNNEKVNNALINYLKNNGVLHSLDLSTLAKSEFLDTFENYILNPRDLSYKIQFVAPSGASGIEAAIKIARKTKQRSGIISFTNGFHGMSLGALSLTGNSYYKNEYIDTRSNIYFAMFDEYLGETIDTADILDKLLEDNSSGVDIPAAIVLETIQAEGGINIASNEWLSKINTICQKYDILLIIDDVQVGHGRTGDFFSFERANIVPDMIVMSKAIGGGMPMALVLIKEEIDKQWKIGEHSGTFRGNNLAFVAGKEVLEYWRNDNLSQDIKRKSLITNNILEGYKKNSSNIIDVRGIGLIYGIELLNEQLAIQIKDNCFSNGLILELVGSNNNIVKLLPPLTINDDDLIKGLNILTNSLNNI
jgi:diaminobutyrate-2-oxoglutarate transaminase